MFAHIPGEGHNSQEHSIVTRDHSYVMASYARFLWDADEEDEEEVSSMNISPPSFLHKQASQQFPVAAT
ncbi:hypothetical protein Tco_1085342 [Tanacetum coccineum]